MITIIHGTDIASSRKYFIDLSQKEHDSHLIDGQNTDLTDFAQIFEGGELFASHKKFFIERLLGKKKKGSDLEKITELINKNAKDNDIFIWENAELSKTSLNLFKNPIQKVFKLPQALFLFLESIRPKNAKALINLFHQAIKTADVEMVFFMIVRQIRLLLGIHPRGGRLLLGIHPRGGRLEQGESHDSPGVDEIDELKKMAPWQKGKLQKQADYFETDELINIYSKLFEIEKGIKTGNLTLPLEQTIDLFLLEI